MDHPNLSALSSAQITPAQQLNEQFADTYRQYRPRIEGYIALRLPRRDSQLAEDLAAEVFTSLWRSYYAKDRPVGSSPWGLLAAIAQRRMADHFRPARNTREVPADFGHWTFANRETAATGSGYYVPATGFRTAAIGQDRGQQ